MKQPKLTPGTSVTLLAGHSAGEKATIKKQVGRYYQIVSNTAPRMNMGLYLRRELKPE